MQINSLLNNGYGTRVSNFVAAIHSLTLEKPPIQIPVVDEETTFEAPANFKLTDSVTIAQTNTEKIKQQKEIDFNQNLDKLRKAAFKQSVHQANLTQSTKDTFIPNDAMSFKVSTQVDDSLTQVFQYKSRENITKENPIESKSKFSSFTKQTQKNPYENLSFTGSRLDKTA